MNTVISTKFGGLGDFLFFIHPSEQLLCPYLSEIK